MNITKLQVDTGIISKSGEPKIKKHKEIYLVQNCATPQQAADRVERLFKDCTDEWVIESVKAENLDDILSTND